MTQTQAAMPYIFDADDLALWCVLNLSFDSVTKDDLFTMACRVGRNSAPWLMWSLHEGDLLKSEAYALTGPVWSMSEYPDSYLEHDEWRELFRIAGFTVDDVRAPLRRPRKPIQLWRGSVPERRSDWSWTYRREVAARYASDGIGRRPVGKLWTALVEPSRVFCRNEERQEAEYVIDTEGLLIEEDTEEVVKLCG